MTPLPLPAGSPLWRRVFARARPFLDAAIEQHSGEARRLLEDLRAETVPFAVQGRADEQGQVVVRFGIPVVGWGELWLASVDGSNIGVASLGDELVYIPGW
jgi:hypothetical protein